MSLNRNQPPVAIVGISALFPGTPGNSGFWCDILSGTDSIKEVPPTHWLIDDYYDPDPAAPDKTYCKRGGFLDPVKFDPLAFGVPPSAIPSTDTAQLLALIVAKQVLEDASRTQFHEIDKSRVSVILGVASTTELVAHMNARMQRPIWVKAMREAGLPEDEVQTIAQRISDSYLPWQESSFPGLLGNVVTGRIANRLDLGGTNCVVDAACASSLSAVQIALSELTLGQSDLVITGGVDALNDILMYMCFSKTPAFSPTGDCRPFSDQADGTIIGEGLGMFALRRLEDAERDGNHIYAVIRGIGSSSDGRNTSVYAPRSEGQAAALRRCYDAAGYGPETVELVEAHGTGTTAGDAAEFGGLRSVFEPAGQGRKRWCTLGSVKSQIGHTKAAAGAAGLFKIAMALHHKVLPPTAKVERPNPKLDLDNSPFTLSTKPRPWIRKGATPRRASVSSFGFGGSNFHLTVEEYTGPAARPPQILARPSELVVLSADSAQELAAACRRADDAPLDAFARQSQSGFDVAKAHRLALVAHSDQDLDAKLSKAAERIASDPETDFATPDGVHYRHGPAPEGKIAFLFPGQGSQYIDMGAGLAMAFEGAREVWDQAADLEAFATAPLHEVVFPPSAFDDEERQRQAQALTAMVHAQPAIAAVSLAQLDLIGRLGLRADCLAGHSFGEVTALHAASTFDLATTLRTAHRRGALMTEAAASTEGAMLAVTAERVEVEALIGRWGLDLTIANDNAPRQVVLSGATAVIEQAAERLAAEGVKAVRLPVASAFHSPIVSASSAPFLDFLEQIDVAAPKIPVYANATAAPYPDQPAAIRRQLAEQLGQPVRFRETIEAMYRDGVRVFVEVGPGHVLTGLAGQCLGDRDHQAVALDRKNGDGITPLFGALAALAARGVALDYAPLWAAHGAPSEAPAAAPAHAVSILGSNYGKPYPPPGGAADLPAPNVPKPRQPIAAATVPQRAAASVAAPPRSTITMAPPPAPATARLATHHPAECDILDQVAIPTDEASATRQASPPAAATCASRALPALDDGRIAGIETFQRYTAEAHQHFQLSMAESHQTFLRVAEQALRGLSGGPAFELAHEATHQQHHERPTVAPLPVPPPRQPEPVAMQAMLAAPAVAAPVFAAEPAAPPATPAVPASAPASAPVAASPGADIAAVLLEVVAEKTGYPQDMLGLDMELEAGLGIDSIKQVEILSALQERLPELPEIDPSQLATLKTLAQIVDFIGEGVGDAPVQAPAVSASAAAPAPIATSPSPDLAAVLLEVVAEKTGYPQDMLGLDMELEAGLGIDSIKQVEILSALQERLPELPEIDPSQLATLKTLGQIVDFMGHNQADVAPAPAPQAPTASAPAATSPSVDLAAVLLEVVAEKTGYPQDMLGLDMELEAGLGIDSIKQVEILSALQERLPELPEIDPSQLAVLKTLGQIVDFMGDTSGVEHRTDVVTEQAIGPPPAVATPTARVPRFVLRAEAVPACGFAMPGLRGAKLVAITPDGGGIADALAAALQCRRIAAEVTAEVPADADAVIYLGGLVADGGRDDSLDVHQAAFLAAKAVAPRFTEHGGVFVTVQDSGGAFGLDKPGDALGERGWLAGLPGLVKTAALEWPKACVKAIDLRRDGRPNEALADALVDELLAGGPEIEVGLGADGQRIRLIEEAARCTEGEPALAENDVVVVSGGARGVTAAGLVLLAQRCPLRYVILGRTALGDEPPEVRDLTDETALKRALLDRARAEGDQSTPLEIGRATARIQANREVRTTLATLEASGSQVRYIALDVRDGAAVARAIEQVRRDWGPISGLIHGAGVLADKRISDKTEEQFDLVFGTKVAGLRALLDATRSDPLKVLCMYSSIAARYGNVGQCDYAMANEVLNKVAAAEAQRRGSGCVVKSINWGPWDGGMVGAGLRKHFADLGVALIPVDAGAAFLCAELSQSPQQGVEVIAGSGALVPPPVRRMEVEVDADQNPYLLSHVIQDQPVLPMVMVLEWFVRAARAVVPGMQPIVVRDLHVLKGVILEDFANQRTRFEICAQPLRMNGVAHIEITLIASDGRVCYRARVELGPIDSSLAEPRPLPASGESSPWPWPSEDIYDGQLFHGPQFQVIRELEAHTPAGGSGIFEGTLARQWPGGPWETDPAALDGGLQLAILWGLQQTDQVFLPTKIGAFIAHGALPTEELLRCRLHGRLVGRSRTENDLTFTTLDGRVVAEMRDVEMHPIASRGTVGS